MLGYLRDHWRAARLRARTGRLVQEQLLELLEKQSPRPVVEDDGRWMLLGDRDSSVSDQVRQDARSAARRLALHNPHARNILRLLEVYVVGPGLKLSVIPSEQTESSERAVVATAESLWSEFLERNRQHFSYREYARRTWRDGECFLRLFARPGETPTVRFVDPERIGPTREQPDSQGILTAAEDVEVPVAYLLVDPETGELEEEIDPVEILHTRVGVDSNQKRGLSIFISTTEMMSCFDRWLDTELTARKLQASIVLWRKVQGSPSQAQNLVRDLASGSASSAWGRATPVSQERYGPGSIVTTSGATEMKFLQPNTNFGDAVPLGRMLLLSIASGAGLPEFMLTSDASNANYASTMVAEGPAVKLFQSEQVFFAGEFARLWRWVMQQAIDDGHLPEGFFDEISIEWNYPELVNRDRSRERDADVKLIGAGVLSRAEVARREKLDPATMQREIDAERGGAE